MPFAGLDRPSLGLSALKASVIRAGFECDVAYLNLEFARMLGLADYGRVLGAPFMALPGDWVFAAELRGPDQTSAASRVPDQVQQTLRADASVAQAMLRARSLARAFLKSCLSAVEWDAYDVVGFASTGPQNVAALALARRLKKRDAGLTVVFGGHNWSGTMGQTQFRLFPFVDYAFTGEADASFPQLLRALATADKAGVRAVPGLLRRTRKGKRRASAEDPPPDLDALPVPDHSDYFASLAGSGLVLPTTPIVPLETSRGCWWAVRGGCTFCGINGDRPGYRSKSPNRILAELDELTLSWPGLPLDVVDSVVSPKFLSKVVTRLAARPQPPRLRFKIRPDVSWRHLEAISIAGACVVCGIESLDDRLLGMMHKGVSALQNVRLLKWCAVLDVPVAWNLLHGLPGETSEDYATQIDLISAIGFTEASVGTSSVVLERSSILWRRGREHGFGEPRPARAYADVYPFARDDLAGLAYFFEHDYRPGAMLAMQINRLQRRVSEWSDGRDAGRLERAQPTGAAVRLVDGRRHATARLIELEPLEGLLFDACDDIRSLAYLHERVRRRLDSGATIAEVQAVMESLVRRRLVVRSRDEFLNLAMPVRGGSEPSRRG